MARITITIRPLHPDSSVCDHKVKPSGKPADLSSDCPGRRAYEVHCSIHGRVGDPHGLRVIAEDYQRAHRSEHLTTKAPTRA
jgi:hypothetical protein